MEDNGDKIRIHEDVASLKTDMKYVKEQVSNHLPTSIAGLRKDIKEIDKRFDGIEKKLAYYAGGIAVLLFLLEVFLRYLQ